MAGIYEHVSSVLEFIVCIFQETREMGRERKREKDTVIMYHKINYTLAHIHAWNSWHHLTNSNCVWVCVLFSNYTIVWPLKSHFWESRVLACSHCHCFKQFLNYFFLSSPLNRQSAQFIIVHFGTDSSKMVFFGFNNNQIHNSKWAKFNCEYNNNNEAKKKQSVW